MSEEQDPIPQRTALRMREYLRCLEEFLEAGRTMASSREIAEYAGVKSGLVRKDLCRFGGFGRPSLGYNIAYLSQKIREILRIDKPVTAAWVGGLRLLSNPSIAQRFSDRKCPLLAIFDSNPEKLPSEIAGINVYNTKEILQISNRLGIKSAVICESDEAQSIAESLSKGGVTAILNLTPTPIHLAENIAVRNLDIASELLFLSSETGATKKPIENDIILP